MSAIHEGSLIPMAVFLEYYGGGPLTAYLAAVRNAWEKGRGENLAMEIPGRDLYQNIPLKYFLEQLEGKPLPEVEDDRTASTEEANMIIHFLNNEKEHDILKLKQGLNRLLQLSQGSGCELLFSGSNYAPDRFSLEEEENAAE